MFFNKNMELKSKNLISKHTFMDYSLLSLSFDKDGRSVVVKQYIFLFVLPIKRYKRGRKIWQIKQRFL